MQHRREENKIFATDQRHFDVRPARQPLIQILGGIETGKSAASDNYFRLFHCMYCVVVAQEGYWNLY